MNILNFALATPVRSLRFEFKIEKQAFVQPCVQINYPNENDYTRTVEIKHVTGQIHPQTVVSYEYPVDGEEPYYPVPTCDKNLILMYENLARQETFRKKYILQADWQDINISIWMRHLLKDYSLLISSGRDAEVLNGAKKYVISDSMYFSF